MSQMEMAYLFVALLWGESAGCRSSSRFFWLAHTGTTAEELLLYVYQAVGVPSAPALADSAVTLIDPLSR